MRVALVDDYEVVVRGVAAMLRSYGDRVEIVELDLDRGAGGTVDIPVASGPTASRSNALTGLRLRAGSAEHAALRCFGGRRPGLNGRSRSSRPRWTPGNQTLGCLRVLPLLRYRIPFTAVAEVWSVAEAGAEPVEYPSEEAGDLHLADIEFVGDLFLGHLLGGD
jgi:hypothetical protein